MSVIVYAGGEIFVLVCAIISSFERDSSHPSEDSRILARADSRFDARAHTERKSVDLRRIFLVPVPLALSVFGYTRLSVRAYPGLSTENGNHRCFVRFLKSLCYLHEHTRFLVFRKTARPREILACLRRLVRPNKSRCQRYLTPTHSDPCTSGFADPI